jgi:hypothetical protein
LDVTVSTHFATNQSEAVDLRCFDLIFMREDGEKKLDSGATKDLDYDHDVILLTVTYLYFIARF